YINAISQYRLNAGLLFLKLEIFASFSAIDLKRGETSISPSRKNAKDEEELKMCILSPDGLIRRHSHPDPFAWECPGLLVTSSTPTP
ncbi:hypothetical protein CEXT_162911, partial [Caerostris extrusa]